MSQVGVLEAFDRALALETHHLSNDPALLYQQLQNRLQWEEGEVRALLDAKTRAAPARRKAVIRLKTQQRESKALVATIGAHGGAVTDCAFGMAGEYIVSVGFDGMARQWDRRSGQEVRSLPVGAGGTASSGEFQGGAICCAVSPDGAFVVCGGSGGSIKLWDPETGTEMWSVSESAFSVNACTVSPGAAQILWARVDQTSRLSGNSVVRVVEPGGSERTIEVKGYIRSMALSPDGSLLAVACYDGFAGHFEVRNLSTGAPLWRDGHPPASTADIDGSGKEVGFPPEIRDCAFSPDGAFVVTAAHDATLRLWNPRSGTWFRSLIEQSDFLETRSEFRRTQTPVSERTACAVTPDGQAILSGSRGGALTLWDTATGSAIATLEGHGDEVTACSIASDGSFAASASRDGTVRIWDMEVARGG